MNQLEIFKGIKVFNGFRAIWVEELKALVIADLQLGEELYLAKEKGILVPQFQLKEMLEDLARLFELVKPKTLIINGDLKHEFGELSKQEWREVRELVGFVLSSKVKPILVRGNHDNYLLTIASKLGLKVYDPYYLERGYLFTHGHKKIEYPKEFHTLIIGHEQPALLLKKGFDKIKVPCLLYGKLANGKNFICLPAFSPLASGTEINLVTKEDLLSPILREEVELKELVPIAIDKEVGALKFPMLRELCE
jgi:hypothetical protein